MPVAPGTRLEGLRILALLAALYGAASCSTAAPRDASSPRAAGDWLVYGGDKANSKASSLGRINASNVRDLEVAWRWASLSNATDIGSRGVRFPYQSTPMACRS
jgi:glucose dehydrogenase